MTNFVAEKFRDLYKMSENATNDRSRRQNIQDNKI